MSNSLVQHQTLKQSVCTDIIYVFTVQFNATHVWNTQRRKWFYYFNAPRTKYATYLNKLLTYEFIRITRIKISDCKLISNIPITSVSVCIAYLPYGNTRLHLDLIFRRTHSGNSILKCIFAVALHLKLELNRALADLRYSFTVKMKECLLIPVTISISI